MGLPINKMSNRRLSLQGLPALREQPPADTGFRKIYLVRLDILFSGSTYGRRVAASATVFTASLQEIGTCCAGPSFR